MSFRAGYTPREGDYRLVEGVVRYRTNHSVPPAHSMPTPAPNSEASVAQSVAEHFVALPRLEMMEPAVCIAADQVKIWISGTLIPEAVQRWDAANAATQRAASVLGVLKSHREAGTFPHTVLKAVSSFEMKAVGGIAEKDCTTAQSRVNAALNLCRSTLLQEGIAMRESEVSSCEKILSPQWLSSTLLEEWNAKLVSTFGSSLPQLTPEAVRPLFIAALEDMDAWRSGRIFAQTVADEKAAAQKAARDLAAADSKMDIDTNAVDATLSEQIRFEIAAATKPLRQEIQRLRDAAASGKKANVRPSFSDTIRASPTPARTSADSVSSADVGSQPYLQQHVRTRERKHSREEGAPSSSNLIRSQASLSPRPQSRTRRRKLLREIESDQWAERQGERRYEARRRKTEQPHRAGQEEEDEVAEESGQQGQEQNSLGNLGRVSLVPAREPRDLLRANEVARGPNFKIWRPSSFPASFFLLSREEQKRFVILHSSLLWLETRMAPPALLNPHELEVPKEIARLLSMNVKFIQRPRIDKSGPIEAMEKLTRAVRLRYHFLGKSNDGFVFKYHLKRLSEWKPPKAHRTIEYGLEIGRLSLENACASVDESHWRPNFSSHTVKALQKLITRDNDILVKPADKNLGLVMLKKSWYIEEGRRQLSDASTYAKVPSTAGLVKSLVEQRRTLIAHYAARPELQDLLTGQLLRFLSSPTEEELTFPEFHHLPKVHKDKLAGRPIVPSYAWVTSSCSILLDDLLQPLVANLSSWILRDSKQLLRELARVELPTHGEQVWLVTADISSMYTNIPTELGIQAMFELAQDFYAGEEVKAELIADLTRFVLSNSYLAFQGEVYHQVQGTAMGTACAPTYANLFVAQLEWDSLLNDDDRPDSLLCYKRYIDDVLAIVKGDRSEVDRFIAKLNTLLPGVLVFVAEASTEGIPFLDAYIMLEPDPKAPANRILHTKVYQKPLNSYQYIPWSSFHPESVKLSLVKGELLRYVRLSSRFQDYQEVVLHFWKRLRARGYPIRWLRKAFSAVRYDDARCSAILDREKNQTESIPLVFHVTYNPVYDQVNAGKALTHIVKHWDPELRTQIVSTSSRRIIRCAHRAPSFQDMINMLNKKALATEDPTLPMTAV
jgi:hypothetical protein